MARRILFDLLLFLSVLFGPFWLSVILALVGFFLFPKFWEGVILLFLSDLLFGIKTPRFFGLPYVGILIGAVAFGMAEYLKKHIRFYQK